MNGISSDVYMKAGKGNPYHDPHTGQFASGASDDDGSDPDYVSSSERLAPRKDDSLHITELIKEINELEDLYEKGPNEEEEFSISKHERLGEDIHAMRQTVYWERKKLRASMKAGNPHHDPLTGQFTSGGTNPVVERYEQSNKQEASEFRKEKKEWQQPHAPTHQQESLILPEKESRERGESVSDNLDVKSDADMMRASQETGGSRVFNFSTGEGGDLDKNVKLVTNTNAQGEFERGTLRVDIYNPETQKKTTYMRKMGELPALVKQLHSKSYAATTQHRRNTRYQMKADDKKFITVNGKVIPISESQGQAQDKQQAQPEQAQAQSDSMSEIREHVGRMNELHVGRIADSIGLDMKNVVISRTAHPDDTSSSKLAGEYDPDTQKIIIYPSAVNYGEEELAGTVAHEAMHMKFHQVVNEYNKQKEQFENGRSVQNLEVYREMKSALFTNRATYQVSGKGVSDYADTFWEKYDSDKSTATYSQAVNETLAETERLLQAGKGDDISQQWKSLHAKVTRFYKELQ